MTEAITKPVFSGARYWAGPAHRQQMPIDVPGGPREDEVAGVLAFRDRSGVTTVDVTWAVEGQVNLSSHRLCYKSPRAALDAGWELGAAYEQDAAHMARMKSIYPGS